MVELRISRREHIGLLVDCWALQLPHVPSGVLVFGKDNALPVGAAIQALVAFKNVKKTLLDGMTFKHKVHFASRV